nr:MAG TPA: hypothetical protein [Caudoviricetes sp.]
MQSYNRFRELPVQKFRKPHFVLPPPASQPIAKPRKSIRTSCLGHSACKGVAYWAKKSKRLGGGG